MDVQLYVYDLSHGLARQMSMQFLGLQIDAVYHTSLVFGGIEYLYGRGVQLAYPGGTHHGRPMEVVPMGKTDLPEDVIQEYLESLKEIYTAEAYDLFAHNCNNFTNDFAMFLVGRGIPDHITTLPRRVLETPFGQMLKSQIDQAMRPITQAPVLRRTDVANGNTSRASNGINRNVQNNTTTGPVSSGGVQRNATPEKLHRVSDVTVVDRLLNDAKSTCAVVFLTSSTCGPCKVVEPLFKNLADEYGDKATFIECDISREPAIAHKFSVSATPTFITFLRGEKDDTWSGADAARLSGNVRLLVESAHPPHPHQQLKLDFFRRMSTQPILFKKVPPVEKLVLKMGDAGKEPIVSSAVQFIKTQDPKDARLPNMPELSSFIRRCTDDLPVDSAFAVYDLVRLMLVDPRVSGYFAEEQNLQTISKLLEKVTNLDKCPYNLQLVSVHLACNIFGSKLLTSAVLRNDSCGAALGVLVSNSLLDQDHNNLRVAAASLGLNIITKIRDSSSAQTDPNLELTIAASVLEALSNERESLESAKALVLCLGRLLYCAPLDAEVFGLCKASDAVSTLQSKMDIIQKADRPLLDDVIQLCLVAAEDRPKD